MRLFLTFVLWFSFLPSLAADDLKAGAAKIDITPPIGYAMWGYAARHDAGSVGVLDPLHARALGVKREHYLRTLAYRLRLPPRGFTSVKTGPVKEVRWLGAEADLTKLPVPLHTDKDTSPYITAMNIVRDWLLQFLSRRDGHRRAASGLS